MFWWVLNRCLTCRLRLSGASSIKVHMKAIIRLGKLNLEAYLFHESIIVLLLIGLKRPVHASLTEEVTKRSLECKKRHLTLSNSQIKILLSVTILTYTASFLLHISIIQPYRKMIKMFTWFSPIAIFCFDKLIFSVCAINNKDHSIASMSQHQKSREKSNIFCLG